MANKIKWDLTGLPRGGKLVEMPPLEYLSKTPSPCGTGRSADRDIRLEGCFTKSSLEYLNAKIERGELMDPLFLDYERKFRGWPSHEGRHRALKAYELGEKKVPVIVFGK